MDYKEAINRITIMKQGGMVGRLDWMNLTAFIQSQQDRLDELLEDCPDCGGCGLKPPDATSQLNQRMAGKMLPGELVCPTCHGSGKVPVCYLEEWFVDWLFAKRISREVLNRKDSELCRVVVCPDGDIVFEKQPNGLWKLERRKP